jgi:hypothetical protein
VVLVRQLNEAALCGGQKLAVKDRESLWAHGEYLAPHCLHLLARIRDPLGLRCKWAHGRCTLVALNNIE